VSARQLWKLLLYAVKCSVDAKAGAVLSRHAGEAESKGVDAGSPGEVQPQQRAEAPERRKC